VTPEETALADARHRYVIASIRELEESIDVILACLVSDELGQTRAREILKDLAVARKMDGLLRQAMNATAEGAANAPQRHLRYLLDRARATAVRPAAPVESADP